MIDQFKIKPGGSLHVQISQGDKVLYDKSVRWVNTFGEAPIGDDVAYINSLLNFSVAVNQGNFSEKYKVFSGPSWTITVGK